MTTDKPLSHPQNRPIKVLFYYLDYGAIGGIERYIVEIASRLKAKESLIEPVVVCSANGWLQQTLTSQQITTHTIYSASCFAGSIWRMFDIFALFQLTHVLHQEQPDVVHVHIGLLENLWIRLLGYPVVYTAHGYSTLYSMDLSQEQNEGISPLKAKVKHAWKRLVRFLFRKTSALMDALLFVSDAEKQRMLTEGFITPKHQSDVIHNGVDLKNWQNTISNVAISTAKNRLGLPENARVVSFINRLDHNKNPAHFIELARHLLSDPQFQDVHFLLAGDGPLMNVVRLQSLSSPQIRVLGYYPDVTELLSISDLIVYPSLKEGFGLGLLEAMAAGKSCIAYASGGASELLNTPETRHALVPLGDLQALIGGAKTFLNATEADEQQLQTALQARAQQFDLHVMLEKLEAVYQQLYPLVSVILPVYQGENLVLRAVDSVLKQSYSNLELIVVDDGSTDNTLSQLETICDPRLKILKQPNQGVASARNHAFSKAQGNYIAFIDADDQWLPHKLTEELKVVHKQRRQGVSACIIYSAYYAVDDTDQLVNLPKIRRVNGDVSQATLEDEGLFLPSTTLIHRSIFEAVGGFQTGCYHEDRAFFIQATQQFPAYATGQRLVIYKQSVFGRCRRILFNYNEALQAELSILETLQDRLPTPTLDYLKTRQLLNLSNRFLMYGFLKSAKQVSDLLPNSTSRSGLKGLLTQISLQTGFNFLAGLRLCIQQGMYPLLNPWWCFTMRLAYRQQSGIGQAIRGEDIC